MQERIQSIQKCGTSIIRQVYVDSNLILHPGSNKPTPDWCTPGRVTGYNGAALNSRWECILSVMLRGTDASNLVAQGTRRLPHASEVHESANRSSRRCQDSNGFLFITLVRARHSGSALLES